MNIELVKLGAETLGWEWRPGWEWASDPAQGDHIFIPGYQTISIHAYWLPAYMAERLVQRCNSEGLSRRAYRVLSWGLDAGPFSAKAPLRIAAALVALDIITLERARELVKGAA